MGYKEYFKGKKITVMGLGLLGRGVGDVKFLAKKGAILTVTDLKTEEQLKESLSKLKNLKTSKPITFHLGGHRLEDFRNRDLIIKAAGVPLDSPFIKEAEKNKIPIDMSTALFAKLSLAKIVGITGTRGKSTVTAMIYEIINNFIMVGGAEKFSKVFLGGNVKGISTLAHLPKSKGNEIAVLELDSWQLQGFGDFKISPHIAVFTTFYPDHLNYYRGDLKAYLEDKANIFKYQTKKDFLILGRQAFPLVKKSYGRSIKSKIIIADSKNIPKNWKLKIPGEHNLYNASCAREATKALGIPEKTIKKAIENFKGVEGRLELVKEIKGVKIYNDTTSTTPNSTIVALKALGKKSKNIVLIFGGNDKSLEVNELLNLIPKFCKVVFLISGSGSDKLPEEIFGLNLTRVKDLKESLEKSLKKASAGDVILFSPAFTSFGQFKNEFDRGKKFMELVKNLR